MEHIQSTIERYGGNPELFLRFADGDPDPRVLSYATIINAQSANSTRFASSESTRSGNPIDAVIGVYEQQTAPLIFLVDGDSIGDDEDQFGAIRRALALRGDTPYLGVVRGGQLSVHHISLEPLGSRESRVHELGGKDQAATFPLLANVRPGTESKRRDNRNWISIVIRDLLESSIKVLLQNTTTSSDSRIADNDAISLVGRALFLRFLGDRDLLPEHLNPIEEIFDSAERAEEASDWLDQTFNGDFLQYSPGLFSRLSDLAMHTLGNIVCRAPRGQLHLKFPANNWNRLDFAHIPVGVLSEAYEAYMRAKHPGKQRTEGAYYTPPFIVDTMVRASFAALRRTGRSSQAVVLDPAVGAGVFLISAFRQLAEERWRQDGQRPDTEALRDILYNHLTGFDINEAALRFAALGLYLMAVELDPEPEPVDKLRFHTNLSGTVLHDFGRDDADGSGSLGSLVPTCHNGRYDLVIGNPPWTSGGDKEKSNQILKTVQTIAQQRLGNVPSLESLLPRQVMDLPFVWRAMEWAKPDAQIAFALHARMLFQQGNGMPEARASLFSAVDVTAIVNGSDLRKTPVWPSVSAPFCLFFARNRLSTVGGGFRFVSPHLEQRLNDSGIIRIDTTNAAWVTPTEVRQCAPILKILFRGSSMDLKIYEKLQRSLNEGTGTPLLTLGYWRRHFGEPENEPRQTGNGYKKSHKGKHTNRVVDDWMAVLPDLGKVKPASMLLDVAALPNVGSIKLGRQIGEEIYRGPLLLIHESPPSDSARIRTMVCDDDVAYNQSWYGYSAKGQPDAELLVRYLALVLGSKFTLWWALVTAGTFGVERGRLDLSVVTELPIIPLETLDADSRNMITKRFDALVQAKTDKETEATWSQVDEWVWSLYRLSSHDQQVINDTLRFGLPFADNIKKAQKPVTDVDIREFRTVLREDLDVWASPEGLSIDVELITHLPKGSPWHVLKIGTKQGTHQSYNDWAKILRTANDIAASEVVMPNNDTRTIQVARLSQARYWTRTHAHLLAQKIVWEHLDTLLGGESV